MDSLELYMKGRAHLLKVSKSLGSRSLHRPGGAVSCCTCTWERRKATLKLSSFTGSLRELWCNEQAPLIISPASSYTLSLFPVIVWQPELLVSFLLCNTSDQLLLLLRGISSIPPDMTKKGLSA